MNDPITGAMVQAYLKECVDYERAELGACCSDLSIGELKMLDKMEDYIDDAMEMLAIIMKKS